MDKRLSLNMQLVLADKITRPSSSALTHNVPFITMQMSLHREKTIRKLVNLLVYILRMLDMHEAYHPSESVRVK